MNHSTSASSGTSKQTGGSGLCTPDVALQLVKRTASYSDKSQELSIVSSSIIMLVLLGLFLAGIFDVRATLRPKFRLLLSSALALFLPVMSYLFSEAKDAAAASRGGRIVTTAEGDDLTVRARTILFWMLLVELLRKKVEEIHMWRYSAIIKGAGRVVWLGSLIFFNIKSIGRRVAISYLWILCAGQLVQRIAFAEVEKRSYHPDKSSWLILSYMEQVPHQQGDGDDVGGDELWKSCKYIVMGEEKLVTADGYNLTTTTTDDDAANPVRIVTVGKVWQQCDQEVGRSIKRLCLSFGLFKLLRPRFEHLPGVMMSHNNDAQAMDCRRLLIRGLVHNSKGESTELFEVMADEVNFLSEYYHSVVPVVLAKPLFVIFNYFLQPVGIFAIGLVLVALILYGNGDVAHALARFRAETHPLEPKQFLCALSAATQSRSAFFFVLDLSISLLLFTIITLENIWETLVVLNSNWFMISMLQGYMGRCSPWSCTSVAFRLLSCLRNKMASKYCTIVRLKQWSLLRYRGPLKVPVLPATILSYFRLPSVPVTDGMKQAVVRQLVRRCEAATSSWSLFDDALGLGLWWQGDKEETCATEIILTLHVATSLLETKLPPTTKQEEAANKVATGLSEYCAYLVVFHPELLPDRQAKAKLVCRQARQELRDMLGFWGYNFSLTRRAHANKIIDTLQQQQPQADDDDDARRKYGSRVVRRGAKLGMKLLMEQQPRMVTWNLLADLWAELIVYVAPSNDEAHVKGHKDILVEGVELITVLWAFAMHTGISRPPRNNPTTTTHTSVPVQRV